VHIANAEQAVHRHRRTHQCDPLTAAVVLLLSLTAKKISLRASTFSGASISDKTSVGTVDQHHCRSWRRVLKTEFNTSRTFG
jgi:hypothetical protein